MGVKLPVNTEFNFGSDVAGLQSPPIRHAYMKEIVNYFSKCHLASEPVRLLEIGSWAGSSTITWAMALKSFFKHVEIICVDPWLPYFNTTINTNPHYALMNQVARENLILDTFKHNLQVAGIDDIVNIKRGISREILPNLADQSFHFIYIDGSHAYADVLYDIRQAQRLVNQHGIICGDDLEKELSVVEKEHHDHAIAIDIDYVRDPQTSAYYHPGVTQAIADTFGTVSVWEGFWAIEKSDHRWTHINLTDCVLDIPSHLLALPRIVETYRGFNLLLVNTEYYCIRQSIGAVDINATKQQLSDSFDVNDLFFCNTVAIAKERIDALLLNFSEALHEPG